MNLGANLLMRNSMSAARLRVGVGVGLTGVRVTAQVCLPRCSYSRENACLPPTVVATWDASDRT